MAFREAVKAREILATNKQAHWAALRLSVAQRFQYLFQYVHPSICEQVAVWLDLQLWRELEAAVGFNIPQGDRGQEGDMYVNIPVDGVSGKLFQEWAITGYR